MECVELRLATVLENKGKQADEKATRQGGLPEDGGHPDKGKGTGPDESGERSGGLTEELPRDVHDQPDGEEIQRYLSGEDDKFGCSCELSEELEDECDEDGIDRSDEGGGTGAAAEGRA